MLFRSRESRVRVVRVVVVRRRVVMPAGRTRAVVWLSAAALAAAIAIGVWRIPVQAHDAIDEIVAGHQSPGVWASFTSTIGSTSYFRPLRFAESKALMDLSGGRYQLAFESLPKQIAR